MNCDDILDRNPKNTNPWRIPKRTWCSTHFQPCSPKTMINWYEVAILDSRLDDFSEDSRVLMLLFLAKQCWSRCPPPQKKLDLQICLVENWKLATILPVSPSLIRLHGLHQIRVGPHDQLKMPWDISVLLPIAHVNMKAWKNMWINCRYNFHQSSWAIRL